MGSVFLYQQHTQMLIDNLANWMERSYSAVDLCHFAIPLHSLWDRRPLWGQFITLNVFFLFCLYSFNKGRFVYALTTLSQRCCSLWFRPVEQFPRLVFSEARPSVLERRRPNYPSFLIVAVLEESDSRYQLQHLPDSTFPINFTFTVFVWANVLAVYCVRMYTIYLSDLWSVGAKIISKCLAALWEISSFVLCLFAERRWGLLL